MHTHSLADYVRCLEGSDFDGMADLMLSSARNLRASGADFLICPDNTIHQAMDRVAPRSTLPWLHIAKVVATEAAKRGFVRVGLTGTRWLVESDVYPSRLAAMGADFVRLEPDERERLGQIIITELVNGVFDPSSTAYFEQITVRFEQRGCDAVVLGCTGIPLIVSDQNSALPTLDSTRLLAMAALRYAVNDRTGE